MDPLETHITYPNRAQFAYLDSYTPDFGYDDAADFSRQSENPNYNHLIRKIFADFANSQADKYHLIRVWGVIIEYNGVPIVVARNRMPSGLNDYVIYINVEGLQALQQVENVSSHFLSNFTKKLVHSFTTEEVLTPVAKCFIVGIVIGLVINYHCRLF